MFAPFTEGPYSSAEIDEPTEAPPYSDQAATWRLTPLYRLLDWKQTLLTWLLATSGLSAALEMHTGVDNSERQEWKP